MTIQARNKPKPGDLQKKLDREKKLSLTGHQRQGVEKELAHRDMDRQSEAAQHR